MLLCPLSGTSADASAEVLTRWSLYAKVRHCALSLVGEPIMYPEINHLISLLHARRVSSFLVTNAQFPDRIRRAPNSATEVLLQRTRHK